MNRGISTRPKVCVEIKESKSQSPYSDTPVSVQNDNNNSSARANVISVRRDTNSVIVKRRGFAPDTVDNAVHNNKSVLHPPTPRFAKVSDASNIKANQKLCLSSQHSSNVVNTLQNDNGINSTSIGQSPSNILADVNSADKYSSSRRCPRLSSCVNPSQPGLSPTQGNAKPVVVTATNKSNRDSPSVSRDVKSINLRDTSSPVSSLHNNRENIVLRHSSKPHSRRISSARYGKSNSLDIRSVPSAQTNFSPAAMNNSPMRHRNRDESDSDYSDYSDYSDNSYSSAVICDSRTSSGSIPLESRRERSTALLEKSRESIKLSVSKSSQSITSHRGIPIDVNVAKMERKIVKTKRVSKSPTISNAQELDQPAPSYNTSCTDRNHNYSYLKPALKTVTLNVDDYKF